jgi:hypothetical protein
MIYCEDSILGIYYEDKQEVISSELVEISDEFLADTSILNEDRDYE